jgi:hypothetical protein
VKQRKNNPQIMRIRHRVRGENNGETIFFNKNISCDLILFLKT